MLICSVSLIPRSFNTIATSHFALLTLGLLVFHEVSGTSLANSSVFEYKASDVFAHPFIQMHSVSDLP